MSLLDQQAAELRALAARAAPLRRGRRLVVVGASSGCGATTAAYRLAAAATGGAVVVTDSAATEATEPGDAATARLPRGDSAALQAWFHAEAAANFELAVVDCGPRAVATIGARSDAVVLVTTPDPRSLLAAYSLLKQTPAPMPWRLLVNRVTRRQSAIDVHHRLATTCRQFTACELAYGGSLLEAAFESLSGPSDGPLWEELRRGLGGGPSRPATRVAA